jgi:hypothetical protein
VQLSTHPTAGGLMKRSSFYKFRLTGICKLSTHPTAGGLMKPRPLKPLSTQADNALLSADFKVFISALSSRGS